MQLPHFPVEWLGLPDEKLGLHLFAWWIGAHAEHMGIPPETVTQQKAEIIRLATLKLDLDDARYIALEKALRRVAEGDAAGGGRIFREYMRQGGVMAAAVDEAQTGKRRQQRIARKRRPNTLKALILEILEKDPKITKDQLLAHLRKQQGLGVIETVSDEDQLIEWTDKTGRVKETKFKALPHRMSRARNKLSSR